jgi:hypothetical protein
MSGSHAFEGWLASHEAGLRGEGIVAVVGRAPRIPGNGSPTWISFESGRSVGRAVLWDSGRCELGATASGGAVLVAEERTVTTTADLDDALESLTDRLRVDVRR